MMNMPLQTFGRNLAQNPGQMQQPMGAPQRPVDVQAQIQPTQERVQQPVTPIATAGLQPMNAPAMARRAPLNPGAGNAPVIYGGR